MRNKLNNKGSANKFGVLLIGIIPLEIFVKKMRIDEIRGELNKQGGKFKY